jgi:RNA polymerase sigma factor (sigma-70 family)
MGPADDARLSQLSTAWTVLFLAHDGPAESVRAARRDLVARYSRPVYRYLTAALRDPDAADEVYQEFALRLVRGDFKRAQPDRGRFRDFLKTVLYHLVVDYRRRTARPPDPLPADGPACEESVSAASDEEFLASWRAQLVARAWEGLAGFERQTGQPLYRVLRLRADEPNLTGAELAARLSATLGRPVDAAWVHKRVHFARDKFAELLVGEVRQTLDRHDPAALADELIAIGLYEYCRTALGRDTSELPG